MLFVIRSFLDQVMKRYVICSCCWASPQAEGRGEEAREKAVGAGLERQLREGDGRLPEEPLGQDQLGKHAVARAAPSPSL